MSENFSGSCIVTSRNFLIHNGATTATNSERLDAEEVPPFSCRVLTAASERLLATANSREFYFPRRWVNKGPLLPSGEKSHGPHRTITPYVCMLNMGCGLGAGNDSSFL